MNPTTDAGLRESWRLLDLPEAWVVVLLVLPAFALISWLGYWRESAIPRVWRLVLTGLRMTTLTVLFGVLCRPVLVERREEVDPAQVLVLIDDSASMQRTDAYLGDDGTRANLRAVAGEDPGSRTRIELVGGIVEKKLKPELEDLDYEVRTFRFADGMGPVEDFASLAGRGRSTHLGDAVLQLLSTHRGRHVTDVVVLSDGRNTGGAPVLDAGQAALAAGIPIHTVTVGDTRAERNAVIELVEAPGNALEGDEVAVTVRVLGRGVRDQGRAQVLFEEVPVEGSSANTRLLREEMVDLREAGERLVLVAEAGLSDPNTNERRFRVSIPPLEGETLTDDNSIEFSVHISPEKIRVLYIDGYPRWEYRYLKNLLLRSDENIQVQCFLMSATTDFPQEASAGLAPLTEIPTTRAELLENYDVIVLGDVNPYDVSNDPARGDEFVQALRDFVASGGGLLFQAGEYDNPRSFPPNSPLEELLPITTDPTGLLAFEADTQTEFRPTLEDPANPHEILRLNADVETNRILWEEEEGLRGFYWYHPIQDAKPASNILLRHPTDQNPRGERYPLLVTGYYPSGRTLFMAVDSTYRWRYYYGDRYHERFWRNAIRWLALGRLKSGDRRFRLETPRTRYPLDERVPLEARVLDEDYRPSRAPVLEVHWSGPDGRSHEEALASTGEREGRYRGTFQMDRPGLYRAWLEHDGQRMSSTEFEVVLPSRENADPSPDPDAMAALAKMTGGTAVSLDAIDDLESEFPGNEERRQPISSKLEDAWDHWGTMLLVLLLLSGEWIARKRWELV